MLGATLLSIPVSQKLFGSLFIWIHRTLAGGAAGVILWHVLGTTSQSARILVICSCAWWALVATFQFIRSLFSFHSGRILDHSYHPDVIKLSVKLKTAIKFYPSCQFYVFEPSYFLGFNLLHSHTALPFYYLPAESRGSASEITLLIPRLNINTPASLKLKNGQRILLSGPYGKKEDVGCYKNVVFATKGVGLAAVLPLALDFAIRRNHDKRIRNRWQEIFKNQQALEKELAISDGSTFESLSQQNVVLGRERDALSKTKLYLDKVKKVDLFWSLESNDQMEWAGEQLRALQALDPQKVVELPFEHLSQILTSLRLFSLFGADTPAREMEIRHSNYQDTGSVWIPILRAVLKMLFRNELVKSDSSYPVVLLSKVRVHPIISYRAVLSLNSIGG